MRGPSSRYALELAAQQSRREITHRHRDDEAGFVGQYAYGSKEQKHLAIDPDANPDVDSDGAEAVGDSAKAEEFVKLFSAILAGTAEEPVLARATKCALDCARMTGRPAKQFMTDAARSVAVSLIYGD